MIPGFLQHSLCTWNTLLSGINFDCHPYRPSGGFEKGLRNVVPIRTVVQRQMECTFCSVDKTLPKFMNEFRVELPDLRRLKFNIIDETGTSRKIDGGCCQCFIHRQGKMSEPPQTGFVAESLGKCLTENNTGVFDGVMSIHMQIAASMERHVDQGMGGKKCEHVVEEAQTGGNLRRAGAIEVECQRDLRFLRIP